MNIRLIGFGLSLFASTAAMAAQSPAVVKLASDCCMAAACCGISLPCC